MHHELIYRIGLTFIPKVGSVLSKNLISYCGGAEAVFKTNKKALLKIPGIGVSIANEILNEKVIAEAEREVELIEKYGIRPIFYLDKEYPYPSKK